jgi:tetratricopeptide (TPR) repeat protein
MIVQPFFKKIREEIIAQLEQANDTMSIAVAWFTDKKIFNILLKKLEQDVKINIILCNDAINFREKGLNWDTFLEKGGKLYAMENDLCLMHHKFAVIDAKTLITGSYNWTYKAAVNRENILVISGDKAIVDDYLAEFKDLCLYAEHLEQIVYPSCSIEKNPVETEYIEEDDNAEKIVKEMIANELQNAAELHKEALHFHNNMEYEKAIERFQQAFKLDNQNAELINAMVWSYIRLFEKYPDTMDFYKCSELLELKKELFTDKEIYYNTLACLYDERKNYVEAIKYLKEALNYAPQSTVCRWNLIGIYEKTIGIYEKTNGKKFVEPLEREIESINRNYIEENEWKMERRKGDFKLMQAYYQNAWLHHKIEQIDKTKEYIIFAKKIFNVLDGADKDLYVYNNFIEKLASKLPKAMQKEFKNA